MKKLMKALALATVMCMLMSVAAFASSATLADEATKTLSITVDTATGAEQVSLVIVEANTSIATENILFVDQKAAADGTATFTAKIAGDVEAVDVYAGNATYAAANSAAELVAEDLALTAPITEASVSVVETKIAEGKQTTADPNHTGGGVGMKVNFTLPNGVTPVKVIWSIRSGEAVYYTPSIDISGLSALEGDVQLGASFINGSIVDDIETIEIDSANAIFLFSDQSEVFTNEADAANRAE
jgi:hypothetical protein